MATTTLTPAASAYRSGLYEWLTTTDHKKIGILYLVNSFVFFFIGGILALGVRRHRGRPPARRRRARRPGRRARSGRLRAGASIASFPRSASSHERDVRARDTLLLG